MSVRPPDGAGVHPDGLWNGTACAPFEVREFAAGLVAKGAHSGRNRGGASQAGLGSSGGAWTACAHLKGAAYLNGFNLAPFLLRLLAYALQPRTALELGCGLGTTADYLARFTPGGSRVTCVEPEPMLAETFALRPLPHRATQLSVNLFGRAGADCASALGAQQFELVYSFEVAEHIAPSQRGALVALLARATARFLVFSAARPGQFGSGHLPGSSIEKRKWVELFAKEGLVELPLLTEAAVAAAYPERGYDIFRNVFVMGRQPTSEHALLRRARHLLDRAGLLGPEHNFTRRHASPMWKVDAAKVRAFATAHNQAIWPELSALHTLLTRKGRKAANAENDGDDAMSLACT